MNTGILRRKILRRKDIIREKVRFDIPDSDNVENNFKRKISERYPKNETLDEDDEDIEEICNKVKSMWQKKDIAMELGQRIVKESKVSILFDGFIEVMFSSNNIIIDTKLDTDDTFILKKFIDFQKKLPSISRYLFSKYPTYDQKYTPERKQFYLNEKEDREKYLSDVKLYYQEFNEKNTAYNEAIRLYGEELENNGYIYSNMKRSYPKSIIMSRSKPHERSFQLPYYDGPYENTDTQHEVLISMLKDCLNVVKLKKFASLEYETIYSKIPHHSDTMKNIGSVINSCYKISDFPDISNFFMNAFVEILIFHDVSEYMIIDDFTHFLSM